MRDGIDGLKRRMALWEESQHPDILATTLDPPKRYIATARKPARAPPPTPPMSAPPKRAPPSAPTAYGDQRRRTRREREQQEAVEHQWERKDRQREAEHQWEAEQREAEQREAEQREAEQREAEQLERELLREKERERRLEREVEERRRRRTYGRGREEAPRFHFVPPSKKPQYTSPKYASPQERYVPPKYASPSPREKPRPPREEPAFEPPRSESPLPTFHFSMEEEDDEESFVNVPASVPRLRATLSATPSATRRSATRRSATPPPKLTPVVAPPSEYAASRRPRNSNSVPPPPSDPPTSGRRSFSSRLTSPASEFSVRDFRRIAHDDDDDDEERPPPPPPPSTGRRRYDERGPLKSALKSSSRRISRFEVSPTKDYATPKRRLRFSNPPASEPGATRSPSRPREPENVYNEHRAPNTPALTTPLKPIRSTMMRRIPHTDGPRYSVRKTSKGSWQLYKPSKTSHVDLELRKPVKPFLGVGSKLGARSFNATVKRGLDSEHKKIRRLNATLIPDIVYPGTTPRKGFDSVDEQRRRRRPPIR